MLEIPAIPPVLLEHTAGRLTCRDFRSRDKKFPRAPSCQSTAPCHLWELLGLPPMPTAQPGVCCHTHHHGTAWPSAGTYPYPPTASGTPVPPCLSKGPKEHVGSAHTEDPDLAGGVGDSAPVLTCQAGRTFSMSFRLMLSPSSSFPFPHLNQKRQKGTEKLAGLCILSRPGKQKEQTPGPASRGPAGLVSPIPRKQPWRSMPSFPGPGNMGPASRMKDVVQVGVLG